MPKGFPKHHAKFYENLMNNGWEIRLIGLQLVEKWLRYGTKRSPLLVTKWVTDIFFSFSLTFPNTGDFCRMQLSKT